MNKRTGTLLSGCMFVAERYRNCRHQTSGGVTAVSKLTDYSFKKPPVQK